MTYSENPLFQIQKTNINYLKGVGPKRGAALKKMESQILGNCLDTIREDTLTEQQ